MTAESQADMVEQPESGTVRLQGVAELAKVYLGSAASAQALQSRYPEGTFGVGELDGWMVEGAELINTDSGLAKLTVLWVTARSPFFFRPRGVAAIKPI